MAFLSLDGSRAFGPSKVSSKSPRGHTCLSQEQASSENTGGTSSSNSYIELSQEHSAAENDTNADLDGPRWTPTLIEDSVSKAKDQHKYEIRKCKRVAWREFLATNSDTQPDMWKTVRRMTRSQSRPALDFVQDEHGALIQDPADIAAACTPRSSRH